MLDDLKSICLKRNDTNKVTRAGFDLGDALLQPGVNVHPVQAAVTQIVQEPQPAEVVLPAPVVAEPAKPAVNPMIGVTVRKVSDAPIEDEAEWNRRVRREHGFKCDI